MRGRPVRSGLISFVVLGTLAASVLLLPASIGAQERAVATEVGQAISPPIQSPATAEEPKIEPAPKRLTVIVGADVPLLAGYVFRGIVQEFDPKMTVQPYVEVALAMSPSVTVTIGTWNSLHTGSLSTTFDSPFYESDLYGSVTVSAGRWKPTVRYSLYGSPSGGYRSVGPHGSIGVQEIEFSTSFDDHGSWLPVSPEVTVAVELTDTQADFGAEKGVYAGIGLRPSFAPPGAHGMTIALPATLGLSARNYYETPDVNLNLVDSRFGYAQIGAQLSVPLRFLTTGTWEAHGGLDLFVFGTRRKVAQRGDAAPRAVKPVLTIGFSATF